MTSSNSTYSTVDKYLSSLDESDGEREEKKSNFIFFFFYIKNILLFGFELYIQIYIKYIIIIKYIVINK